MAKKEKVNKDVELKTWDKLDFLRSKLDERPREFYILMSAKHLKLCFAMVFLCFVCIGFQFYKIYQVKMERSYYVSGIDGQIYNPKIDEEKYQKIVKALNMYYSERDAARNASSQPQSNNNNNTNTNNSSVKDTNSAEQK